MSLRRFIQERQTLYKSASWRSTPNDASLYPSWPGGVGRLKPVGYSNRRGSAMTAPGGGESTGTGRIGENGPKAPSVNVLGGRGKNGPYTDEYPAILSRFATRGEIWPMPICAPCGGGVGRAPPGTALAARRIAAWLAKGPPPLDMYGQVMTLMVDGFCHRCGKPLGKVAWHSADFVWHRKCWKAHEVYTPPPWPGRQNGWARDRAAVSGSGDRSVLTGEWRERGSLRSPAPGAPAAAGEARSGSYCTPGKRAPRAR